MPARSWPVRSCVTSEMTLQPIAGQLQQLRRGREIPICVNRVDVAEIGRQNRQSRTWIIAVAIGVEDGVDRKAVSKIVPSDFAAGQGKSHRQGAGAFLAVLCRPAARQSPVPAASNNCPDDEPVNETPYGVLQLTNSGRSSATPRSAFSPARKRQ